MLWPTNLVPYLGGWGYTFKPIFMLSPCLGHETTMAATAYNPSACLEVASSLFRFFGGSAEDVLPLVRTIALPIPLSVGGAFGFGYTIFVHAQVYVSQLWRVLN